MPFTNPDTCTTLPSFTLLAPLIFSPPVDPSAPTASLSAFCAAIPRLALGAPDEDEESRSESVRLLSKRSWDQAELTSPFGVRLSRSRFYTRPIQCENGRTITSKAIGVYGRMARHDLRTLNGLDRHRRLVLMLHPCGQGGTPFSRDLSEKKVVSNKHFRKDTRGIYRYLGGVEGS